MMTDDEHNGTAAADLMMTDDRRFGRVSTVLWSRRPLPCMKIVVIRARMKITMIGPDLIIQENYWDLNRPHYTWNSHPPIYNLFLLYVPYTSTYLIYIL